MELFSEPKPLPPFTIGYNYMTSTFYQLDPAEFDYGDDGSEVHREESRDMDFRDSKTTEGFRDSKTTEEFKEMKNPEDEELNFPEGGRRAWLVAVGTAGVTFSTLGYINSYGVFQGWYENDQLRGMDSSSISWIGSLQAFFIFGGGLFGGPLFDLYGAKVIRPAAVAYVLSIFLTSLCKKYWHFMLAQGVLGGISNGMVMCPTMAAAPQYFNKKRAPVMGLGIAGSSIGGVVIPIALSQMLTKTNLGFGWSVRIIAIVVLAILFPSAIMIKARLPPRKRSFFIYSAFKEKPYVTLIIAGFFGFLGMFTPLFYLPLYAISRGMSPGLAFYLSAIFNGASFFGRVIPGILAFKLGQFNMFIFATLSSAILTFAWQFVKTNAELIAFTSIFGFCAGAIVSGMAVSFASVPKRPKDIGTYMGMGMAISAIAALVGPPINGALLTRDHGQFGSLANFSGAMNLVSTVFVLLAKYFTGNGMFSKT